MEWYCPNEHKISLWPWHYVTFVIKEQNHFLTKPNYELSLIMDIGAPPKKLPHAAHAHIPRLTTPLGLSPPFLWILHTPLGLSWLTTALCSASQHSSTGGPPLFPFLTSPIAVASHFELHFSSYHVIFEGNTWLVLYITKYNINWGRDRNADPRIERETY